MAKRFLLSDESINSYGFRILTGGIDMSDFKKNPICLWNHARTWRGTSDEVLPIGKWLNLSVSEGKLYGEVQFDEGDEFAQKIASKVENGYLNACSVGVQILEWSEDPKYLVKGQTRPTATKCRLVEVSITDIPSNRNALALMDADGQIVTLSDGGECPLPLLTTLSQPNKETMEVNFTQVALSLGLSDTSETAIIAKIKDLKAEAAKVATLTAELQVYKDKELNERKAAVESLLSDAVKANKITEAQKPNWVTLFDHNFDAAKSLLESMLPMQRLADVPSTTTAPGASGIQTHNGKTFSQLSKEDPAELARLKDEQPEVFKSLFKSEFKKEYRESVR